MPNPNAPCPACKAGTQNWTGAPRNCGFKTEGHVFTSDNWNCQTLNLLRETARALISPDHITYHDDCSLAWIPCDEGWIVLSWYKSRGATPVAQVITGTTIEPLTYEIAQKALKKHDMLENEEASDA